MTYTVSTVLELLWHTSYLSKTLLISIIPTFLCIHCFYVMFFALKRPNSLVLYCYLYGCHWASLRMCEVGHCRWCFTSAKQILINELQVCLFFSDKSRQRIKARLYAERERESSANEKAAFATENVIIKSNTLVCTEGEHEQNLVSAENGVDNL